jgi:lipoyl(octanoyl) transferase 2
MSSRLPPVFYHLFTQPLPYARTLQLQEQLHNIQLARRRAGRPYPDLLLMLEHRPVYTAGRRQVSNDPQVTKDEERLTQLGANFVSTQRGGQYTYHGPGQIVGYPLLDLGRTSPAIGIRDYICNIQTSIKRFLADNYGIATTANDNTGVFLDEHTKIASIGVQVRHRLTTHGFSLNVTPEPYKWFEQVVACGLTDVKPGCIADAGKCEASVPDCYPGLVRELSRAFERDMKPLIEESEPEIVQLIAEMNEEAIKAGDWPKAPAASIR